MTTAASPTPSSRFKLITSTLLDAGRVDDAPLDAALDVDASSSANLPARPLSRADYFRRLRAFRDCVRWNFDKPSALQGPACAARGWTLEARDLLRCETCEALLAYPGNVDKLDEDARKDVNERVMKDLVDTHERGCAWRETGCSTSARGFPAASADETRADFASRVDAIARRGGKLPMVVGALEDEGRSRPTSEAIGDGEKERIRALVRDARTHAEEAETSASDDADDLTPLERRSAIDYATEMGLFGWSPTVVDGDLETDAKGRAAYCCALCGVRAPEWTFTPLIASRKQLAMAQSSSSKKPKTTLAALRGAAGGTYGLGTLRSAVAAAAAAPFAPKLHEEKPAHSPSVKSKWVAAVAGASVLSKLTASIAGGGASDAKVDSTPFGSTTSSTPLFGSPRPVTTMTDATPSATLDSEQGSKFASIVVAAATKKLAAAKKRKRVAVDENAKLNIPALAVRFNVIDEHLPYCPWISTRLDHRDVDPGWRATLDVLVPRAAADAPDAAARRRADNFKVVDYARARDMVRKYLPSS